MKKFFGDCIALHFAAVGVLLMVLVLAWRINPVEGSVIPRFLRANPLGMAVLWGLFVTCMPAYIAGMLLAEHLIGGSNSSSPLMWFPEWLSPHNSLAILFQAIPYFLLGKAVSIWARRLSRKRKSNVL